MPVRVRVRDEGEGGLCEKCKHVSLIRGRSPRGGPKTAIYCHALGFPCVPIRFEVEKCSSFEQKGALSLYEMKQQAWLLSNETGKKLGFLDPKKMDREERERILNHVEDPL